MKGFAEREKGFEAEFGRRQEEAFRITARRNKLLGLWAADRLGLGPGAAAEAYAAAVVAADLESPGDDDVLGKLRADFAAQGIAIGEKELRLELERAEAEARRERARR